MSDIQLRSDELVQRGRAGYDAQRYSSMRDIGNEATRVGQQVPEIMQAQQALDQKWVEVGQRGAAQQAEINIAQKKLNAALAIDGTSMSYEAVRGARLQNDAMEHQIQEAKKRMEMLESNQQSHRDLELAQAINQSGNEGLFKIDPNAPAGTRFTPRTDAEYETWVQQQSEMKSRRATAANPAVEAKRALDEWSALVQTREKMVRSGASDEQIADLDQQIDERWRNYQSYRPQSGGGAAQQNGAAKTTALDKGEVDGTAKQLLQIPEESRQLVAQSALHARGLIAETMRQGGLKNASEKDALDEILRILNDPSEGGRGRRENMLKLLARFR